MHRTGLLPKGAPSSSSGPAPTFPDPLPPETCTLRPQPHRTSQHPLPAQFGQTPSSKPRSPSPRPLTLTPASPATGGGPPQPQPPDPRGHRLGRGRRNRRAQVLFGPPAPRKF